MLDFGDVKATLLIKRCFQLICCLLAILFIFKQISDYLRNEDVSVISYRKYSAKEADKYPTFTICLRPSELDLLGYPNILYREEVVNQTLGITGPNYYYMLSGGSFKENVSNFQQIFFQTNLSVLEFDDAKRTLLGMVRSYLAQSDKEETLKNWNVDLDSGSDAPFYQGYQDPECLCLTRSNIFYPLKRMHMENLFLDVEGWIGDLLIYLHYPGQLMNVIQGNERMKIKLSENRSEGKELKFVITQLQVLRKRHGGNIPCNMDSESDVDTRWRESVMKIVGCIPTYWKRLPHSLNLQPNRLNDCSTSTQYEALFNLYSYKRDHNITYESSCTWPTIISNFQMPQYDDEILDKHTLSITFNHESGYYMNVENLTAITFDDLWSQVGGLVGIFLGYSLSQFPDILMGIISSIKNTLLLLYMRWP